MGEDHESKQEGQRIQEGMNSERRGREGMEQQTEMRMYDLGMEREVRELCNGEFYRRREDGEILTIKNRYEAYGLISDNYLRAVGFIDELKKNMKLQAAMLPINEQQYADAVDQMHAICIKAMAELAEMAVKATNIIYGQMIREPDALPMEQMAEAETEEE